MVDLMRHITVPHAMDFMAVSSYGAGARASSGNVRMSLDLQTNIAGKNVLLVEDIVDSGNTISYVLEFLQTRQPKSLKVCTLLDKEERREISVPIHYRGFSIPNKFVFGYGLDLDEYYRNLPFVAVVDLEKYQATFRLNRYVSDRCKRRNYARLSMSLSMKSWWMKNHRERVAELGSADQPRLRRSGTADRLPAAWRH